MNKYDIALDIACQHNEELKQNYLSQAEQIIKDNEVTILFTTDIHTEISKLHYVTEHKARLMDEGRNVILVDSGDINEKAKDVTSSMNGYYDVVVGGNHDSLCNGQNFFKRVGEAEFEYIGYDLIKDNIPVFEPYVIYDLSHIKIGFVGQGKLNIGSGKWNGMKTKRDPLILKEYVDKIRGEVDYVILLLHEGEDEAKKILKKVHGIDVILGAHTHKIVNKTLTDLDGKSVVYAQAGVRLNCYGEMTISDTINIELKGV